MHSAASSPEPMALDVPAPSLRSSRGQPAVDYRGMAQAPRGRAPQPYHDVIRHPEDHRESLSADARSAFERYQRRGNLTSSAMVADLDEALDERLTRTAQDEAIRAAAAANTDIDRRTVQYDPAHAVQQGIHVAHKLSDNVIGGLVFQMGHQAAPLTDAQRVALRAHGQALTGDDDDSDAYVDHIEQARAIYAARGGQQPLPGVHDAHLRQAVQLVSNGMNNLRHGDGMLNMAISRGADWNREADGRMTPLSAEIERTTRVLSEPDTGLIRRHHAIVAVTPTRERATGAPLSSSEVAHAGPSGPLQMSERLQAAQAVAVLARPAARRAGAGAGAGPPAPGSAPH